MTEETSGSEGSHTHLTKSRLEALSDGIFAFAMTLLVISLSVPDKDTLVSSNAYALADPHRPLLRFRALCPRVPYPRGILAEPAYAVPFRADARQDISWINLLTLMFVALLPFSSSFSGAFSGVPVGAMVFETNLLLIGMGLSLQWWYATDNNRLTETTLTPAYIRKVRIRNLIVPAVSFVGILFALSGNTWSSAIYMTLPVVFYLVERAIR